jgi:hypothetical protein
VELCNDASLEVPALPPSANSKKGTKTVIEGLDTDDSIMDEEILASLLISSPTSGSGPDDLLISTNGTIINQSTTTSAVTPQFQLFVYCFEKCRNTSFAGLSMSNVTVGNVDSWDEFLECALGPRRIPALPLTLLSGVYILLFVTGLFGNLCTVLVIVKNRYMHNATNFYLFNLALADMTSLTIGERPRKS